MIGIGLGLLNGVIIAFGRIPDFATLGTMMVFGMTYAITQSNRFSVLVRAVIGGWQSMECSYSSIHMAAIAILAHLFFNIRF